jgi:hypothetical protein
MQLINVLSALVHHNYALPGLWLQPLMALTETKLKQLDRRVIMLTSSLRKDAKSMMMMGYEDRGRREKALESLTLMTQQVA